MSKLEGLFVYGDIVLHVRDRIGVLGSAIVDQPDFLDEQVVSRILEDDLLVANA